MLYRLVATLLIISRINNNLIAGRFSYAGLHQLHTNYMFWMQLTKAYEAEMSCNQVVIDSTKYLLKISSS